LVGSRMFNLGSTYDTTAPKSAAAGESIGTTVPEGTASGADSAPQRRQQQQQQSPEDDDSVCPVDAPSDIHQQLQQLLRGAGNDATSSSRIGTPLGAGGLNTGRQQRSQRRRNSQPTHTSVVDLAVAVFANVKHMTPEQFKICMDFVENHAKAELAFRERDSQRDRAERREARVALNNYAKLIAQTASLPQELRGGGLARAAASAAGGWSGAPDGTDQHDGDEGDAPSTFDYYFKLMSSVAALFDRTEDIPQETRTELRRWVLKEASRDAEHNQRRASMALLSKFGQAIADTISARMLNIFLGSRARAAGGGWYDDPDGDDQHDDDENQSEDGENGSIFSASRLSTIEEEEQEEEKQGESGTSANRGKGQLKNPTDYE